jgi:hypothetical protein
LIWFDLISIHFVLDDWLNNSELRLHPICPTRSFVDSSSDHELHSLILCCL